jgi:peptidoglycan DL-endopeptidase CwlO
LKTVSRTIVVLVLLFSMMSFAQAAANNVIQDGDCGQEVTEIQSQLNALGYPTGAADGDFGAATVAAVKAFQKDRGLEADGVVGPSTYRALMGRDIPVSRDSSATTVRRVVQTAMRYVGVPYAFGGTSPDGFDCSGFVRYVFARSGVYLPRMADEQYEVGYSVPISRLQPGDTVYFSTYTSGISHVGIYLGDGKFISASSSRGVVIDRLDSGYWGPRYVGARRIL